MTSQDLADRYGAPAPWRRPLFLTAGILLLVAAAAWLVWSLVGFANPSVKSSLVTWDIKDEHSAEVTVGVRGSDDPTDVECLVRAFAEDHQTVGELAFAPDLSAGNSHLVTVRTDRRATAIELIGCTAQGQTKPR